MASDLSTTPSLIGRDAVLARLRATVQAEELVTVVGPPGMGKSRLAAAVLAGREGWACDLAAADTVELACDAVAASLGVAGAGEPASAIARRLASAADPLLVLDNFEGLAERAAALLTPWREAAPALHVLVTSRERLRLRGEVVFPVPPLSAGEGVTVLVERLQRARPDYQPSPDERGLLAEIAVALDGIPLALELAAAPLEALGAEAFRDRLEERLSLLNRNRRDAHARQATLRRAIDDSWRLLDEDAAEVLCRCALFRGGFDLEAADAVVGRDALMGLQDLRDRSLVWLPAPGRFALYESIRVFAEEQLNEDERKAVESHHAAHYLGLAAPHEAHFEATGQLAEGLAVEHQNLLAVLERGIAAQDPSRARAAILALGPHFKTRGPVRRQAEWLDRVLALEPPAPEALWVERGAALRTLGRAEEAEADLKASLQSDEPGLRMVALKELGLIHHNRREIEAARERYSAARALAEASEHRRHLAILTGNLGALDHDVGRFEAAQEAYDQALDLLREVGDRRLEGIFLVNAAVLAHEEGRLETARLGYGRGLELLAEVDRRFEAIARGNLAVLDHEEGNLDAAADGHEAALNALVRFGDLHSEALARARLAAVRATRGELEEAVRGFDAAERSVVGRDPVATSLVRLYRAFVELASGDESAAARRLERAQHNDDGPSLAEVSDDARFALRLLVRSLSSHDAPKLEVGAEGRWFRVPGGPQVSLHKHAAGRNLLAALVALRLAEAEGTISPDALFAAGWPGVTIDPRSAKNRLHVGLAKLRKLGLKPYLLREPEGYRLDPQVPVVRLTE